MTQQSAAGPSGPWRSPQVENLDQTAALDLHDVTAAGADHYYQIHQVRYQAVRGEAKNRAARTHGFTAGALAAIYHES